MIQSKTYQSANYGYFTLQEDFTMGANPKKIILVWWDPEECNDGNVLNEEIDDDLFSFCLANPNNLSSEDFKDIPANGYFQTFDEAYNYLVSKFGTLS